MPARRLFTIGVALAIALAAIMARPALIAAQAPAEPRVELTPLVDRDAVRAGSRARIALRVVLPEGYHSQSNKPRDPSLIPTVVWVDPPDGVTATEVVFPPSSDFRVEGLPELLAVLDREFVVGITIEVAKDVAPGTIRIPGRLRYQACNDRQCLRPRSADTAWEVRIVGAADAEGEARHADVFGGIPFGTGDPPPTTAPPPPAPTIPPAVPTAGGAAAGSSGVGGPGVAAGSGDDPLRRLNASFELRGSQGGYLRVEPFLEFIRDAEAGVTRAGWFDGRGVVSILAIVFAGGLALNLTPCVLPMIPINLAIIGAGARAGKRRRGFALGLAYGGAMAVVYGALGLIVILTAGTFGAINSSVWFNVGIAVLFVVLALAMFDVITIDFSRWSSRIRFSEGSQGSAALAFGMGAVAALLAGACVAPVVIQVVLFASDLYARGTAIALALPFVLGLGMALPWPIAGAGMASLPKPGAWMVRVKQAIGVFILASAAYYGYLGYTLWADRQVDPASVQASIEEQMKAGWYGSLDAGIRAAEASRTPILIDLWATWCKNCLVMDETTLVDPRVQKALEGYTKIKMQAEDLDAYPASELLRQIRQFGLPAYAVYWPR